MSLVTCVQMVAGRMKLDNHFVTNVRGAILPREVELRMTVNVVSDVISICSRSIVHIFICCYFIIPSNYLRMHCM